jgi:hypothetical protein
MGISGYQAETMLAWLANLAWIVAVVGAMAWNCYRGFKRYPWPEWARRRRNR